MGPGKIGSLMRETGLVIEALELDGNLGAVECREEAGWTRYPLAEENKSLFLFPGWRAAVASAQKEFSGLVQAQKVVSFHFNFVITKNPLLESLGMN